MELSRRSFLGGTVAIATCSALKLSIPAPFPIIRGDGIYDDTAGLNAFFAREPVIIENELLQHYTDDSLAMLVRGDFRVTRPLYIRKPATIIGCHFDAREVDGWTFNIAPIDGIYITDIYQEGGPRSGGVFFETMGKTAPHPHGVAA